MRRRIYGNSWLEVTNWSAMNTLIARVFSNCLLDVFLWWWRLLHEITLLCLFVNLFATNSNVPCPVCRHHFCIIASLTSCKRNRISCFSLSERRQIFLRRGRHQPLNIFPHTCVQGSMNSLESAGNFHPSHFHIRRTLWIAGKQKFLRPPTVHRVVCIVASQVTTFATTTGGFLRNLFW